MDRVYLEDLRIWFKSEFRKPLVLRGARQVGKSSLVRLFAQSNNLVLNEINLEQNVHFDQVFKTLDIEGIESELNSFFHRSIRDPGSILFLDEIQATPHALAALRYFHEQRNDIAVIAAGSLLEFVLEQADFSMPVGRVEYLYMGPMTFEEFLAARGERFLLERIRQFNFSEPWPETLHLSCMKQLRSYLMVGGMPEAVQAFVKQPATPDWSHVQESILQTYKDDFTKYSKRQRLAILHEVFMRLSSFVGHKAKYSQLAENQRASVTREVVELLTYAKIIRRVFHSSGQGIPLGAQADLNHYKLYMVDVGLVNRGLGILPFSSLFDSQTVFEGPIAEQFVAQHIANFGRHRLGQELYYWHREQAQSNAEVDFLIQYDAAIIPIEVKAGTTGSLRSLHQFMLHSSKSPFAIRFNATGPSITEVEHLVLTKEGSLPCKFTLLDLPLYMIGQLTRLISLQNI
jgi:uncharacterized protein